MEPQRIKYDVLSKGSIEVLDCIIYDKCKTICILIISTDYRYPEIECYGDDGDGVPSIVISQGEDDDKWTDISFPELKGWSFICGSHDKRDIYTTLVKR